MNTGRDLLTVAIIEHFSIPSAEIEAITAIIEPHP